MGVVMLDHHLGKPGDTGGMEGGVVVGMEIVGHNCRLDLQKPLQVGDDLCQGCKSGSVLQVPHVLGEEGTVTAGSASGINDGAAAVVVTSAEAAKKAGLTPIARIVSGGVCGVDPDIMGIGPAPSSRQALGRAGLKVQDMDLVEINEAFATQYLAVEKDLGLDREKTNVNGGAIALGHPTGCSGARILVTLLHELARVKGRYGIATLCVSGGQGMAVLVERV